MIDIFEFSLWINHKSCRNKYCNTSYHPGQFAVVFKLQTGGLYAQRSQGRIDSRVKAYSS